MYLPSKLAADHWEYVLALLHAHHALASEMTSVVEFHYTSAFDHGVRHGREDAMRDGEAVISDLLRLVRIHIPIHHAPEELVKACDRAAHMIGEEKAS